MTRSLIEALPGIVASGKRQAAQMLENLEGRNRLALQSRELVIPSRDAAQRMLLVPDEAQLESEAPNRLIYGDNLLAIAALLAGDEQHAPLRGQVDLIYIDPPFDSKADYRTKVTLPKGTLEQKPTVIEQFAYSDTWADGTASYLAMITPRLALMRELLSETGSIYVHLDWHVGHYVKLVLDELFGKENFVNEIVWHYRRWTAPSKNYQRLHDTLFWYARDKSKRVYNTVWVQPANEEKGRNESYERDEDGRLFRWQSLHGQRYKIYRDDKGVHAGDVWDISYIHPSAKERTDYGTQKPEALMQRIIEAHTKPGDLVADFFVGSGTTAAVSERLGRRWVAVDIGKPATLVTRKRLIDQGSKPFLYQAIGDYQVEQARSTLGRRFRVGELAQVVLRLYGAVPLPEEDNPSGNLGRVPGGRTLVLADSPAKLTTAATLRRAIQARDTLLGGFDRVVVLGWNFAASIGQDVAALNDPRLEVLVIPPDLLDRLKKKGSLDKIAKDVRFSSLQYLEASLEPVPAADGHQIRVQLDNYVLLSPEAINLDDKNRQALYEVMNRDPLSLIEYWAVDPDYDGRIFRSIWQDYRGNTLSASDEYRVVTECRIDLPESASTRTVCVRAVDVFGFESEVISSLPGGVS